MDKEEVIYTPEDIKRINKQAKRIRKMHSFYIRDKKGNIRNLNNVSQNITDLILVKFIKEDGRELYNKTNKLIKKTGIIVPLVINFDKKWKDDVKLVQILTGENKPIVFYNGTFTPIVKIVLSE